MIRIKVQRGFGVRQGPDVVDALLATEPAALARGAKEIDASDWRHKVVIVQIMLKDTVRIVHNGVKGNRCCRLGLN